ncbi:MAG TPA: T9SS type A sorting domain-containing protein [Bacteroidia bacterium]|jgi:hypothetical protein
MRPLYIIAAIASFLLQRDLAAQCLTATNGQWPSGTFTPSCSGSNQNITTSGFASEYSMVNVVSGNTYTFSSSVGTDFITIANGAGTVSYTTGTGSVTWVATVTGAIRFYTHTSSACGAQSTNRTRRVSCTNAPITACSGNFYDSGGSGANYSNNENTTTVICPSVAGQCVSVQFTSWNLESGWDYLYVYDGNSTAATQIAGSPFSGSSPGTITGSTTNVSGCLTFRFVSDGATTRSGWAATLSCGACASAPSALLQDCGGGTTICSNTTFSGNSTGGGNYSDFTAANTGCLDVPEHQTSWYYFSSTTNGTIGLTITPGSSSDDYDWAIWGPMGSVACPPSTTPIRCSAADGNNTAANITGLGHGAGDVSEGPSGNGWVSALNVLAGEIYIMVLDNWTATSSPFTLSWQLSNGANLNCAPLPIELISISGRNEGRKNRIDWTTATETNNDYFSLERSKDGILFESLTIVDGAGSSSEIKNYTAYDNLPLEDINYYRIRQTDHDGHYTYSKVIAVKKEIFVPEVFNIHPNPASNELNFEIQSPSAAQISIQIVDVTGRVVADQLQWIGEGRSVHQANLQNLSKGLYTLKIEFTREGYRLLSKIVKQ